MVGFSHSFEIVLSHVRSPYLSQGPDMRQRIRIGYGYKHIFRALRTLTFTNQATFPGLAVTTLKTL